MHWPYTVAIYIGQKSVYLRVVILYTYIYIHVYMVITCVYTSAHDTVGWASVSSGSDVSSTGERSRKLVLNSFPSVISDNAIPSNSERSAAVSRADDGTRTKVSKLETRITWGDNDECRQHFGFATVLAAEPRVADDFARNRIRERKSHAGVRFSVSIACTSPGLPSPPVIHLFRL